MIPRKGWELVTATTTQQFRCLMFTVMQDPPVSDIILYSDPIPPTMNLQEKIRLEWTWKGEMEDSSSSELSPRTERLWMG